MGRGSDTRIYNPRSESSHMFRANHEDESTPTGMEDARDKEARMDRKQKKKEREEKEDRKIRHIKVRRHHMGIGGESKPEAKPDPMAPTPLEDQLEPSNQTMPAGAGGFLTSLAMQAKGPGAAGGEMIQMGEPMEAAWSALLKMSEAEMRRYHHPEELLERVRARRATRGTRLSPGRVDEIAQAAQNNGERNVLAGIPEWLKYAHREYEPLIMARASLSPKASQKIPYTIEEKHEMGELAPVARQAKMPAPFLYNAQRAFPLMIPPTMANLPPEPEVEVEDEIVDSPIPGMVFINGRGPVPDPRIKNASEPMDAAWSELLKSKRSQAKRRKTEERAKWRPSTGKFKRPRGGYTGRSGTSARAKLLSRNLPPGRKTGLMRPHLAVEMSHRGIASKQPMSKDPQAYGQYRGYQEQQNILGQIRPQGGARLPFGQVRGPMAPRPRLHPVRAPSITPPKMHMPHLNRPKMPGMVTMSEDRVPESDILKAKENHYLLAEARTAMREMRELMRQMKEKDSKKKGMGTGDTAGAASSLPKYPGNNPKQTTNPEGGTEDETDARTFGLDPIGHLTGRGGNRA